MKINVSLAPWQLAALNNPFDHFAFFGGVAAGKSFTGAHYAIKCITEYPDVTGFIGANTYDQLSHATLRELFYWLEHYGFDFISDRRPPADWKFSRSFKSQVKLEIKTRSKKKTKKEASLLKSFKNTIVVRNPVTGRCTLIFARVLSKPNPLRGIEFSWYWMDESRDTPENTHDVILSRLRESKVSKGIITTTPNGKDWTYNRFCNPKSKDFGAMHVRTIESVNFGIITQKYYDIMRSSYSEMMAMQELDALHVNVNGGRAYYSSGEYNRLKMSPWGTYVPSRDLPLVVGCDFNFSPAPCIWVVGQKAPDSHGVECIHWFEEVSGKEISTIEMTHKLISKFPGFEYHVYGDMSGTRGTTSNMGKTDYDQMSNVFSESGDTFYIQCNNSETKANPKVKSRVENVNRLLKNSAGEVLMTYNYLLCPYLDNDMQMVGWRTETQSGRGKLDDMGDKRLTHASDAIGYAVWILLPPHNKMALVKDVESVTRKEYGLLRNENNRY